MEKCISMESNVAYAAVKTCQDTKNVCNLIFNDRAILFVEIIDTSKHFFRTQHCLYRCKGKAQRYKHIQILKMYKITPRLSHAISMVIKFQLLCM